MLDHRILWVFSAGLLGCSCGHTTAPSSGERSREQVASEVPGASEGSEREATTAAAAATPQAAPATPPAPRIVPGVLHFDLAAHPERAELRQGESIVLDLGTRGGAKYTFGGWLSGAGDDHRFGDTDALIVKRKRVELALPAPGPGPATLSMRLRGFRAGPMTAYVNGETVGHLKLSGDDFEIHDIALKTDALKAGDNRLELRVSRTGARKGIGSVGMALDWIRLTPAGQAAEATAPPSAAVLSEASEAGARLQVPAGWSLGYALEVPARARLRGALAAGVGGTAGTLHVVAVRDGAADLPLAELSATAEPAPLDIDLGVLEGEVARIELRADGGDVQLGRARIVTLGDASGQQAAAPTPTAPTAPTVGAVGADSAEPAEGTGGRPRIDNVVIVLIDTLRADKLGPYNPKSRVKTPGLQTFLRHSAVMLNARTQENWTKPSVATLLSSLLPWQHNATKDAARVPNSVTLLPELLKKRGFYTGSFIANGYVSDKFGFKQGWNTYRNYIREGRRTKAQYVRADVLEWLDARPKDKPFFLYMHTIDPHVPYKPPMSFVDDYDPENYTGPVDFRVTGDLLEKVKTGRIKLDRRDKQHLEALYDAEISYHDVHFAAVMEGLEKRGLADNTAVIVTADHGEEFWDHGSVGHGHSVYDELLHIPLIVRIPGVTHGAMALRDAVGLVDVMPTILEALGQPVPAELAGKSFLPQLAGQRPTAPRTAVSGFMRAWRTLAVGNYKLVHRTLRRSWLYEVGSDPGEKHDLAAERPVAVRYTRGLLGLTLADASAPAAPGARPRVHKQRKVHIDGKTAAQLRALGYLGVDAK